MEPEKKVEAENKNVFKDILFPQLKVAFQDLVKVVVNGKNLGLVILLWFLVSIAGSIYRKQTDMCNVQLPIDTYFSAKMLCPIE